MKKVAYILLMIGLMLTVQSLQAQCPLYQTYINKGNQLLQADKLTEALNAYLAAQIHCPSRAEEAQKKIKLVFDRINQQKAEIEAQRDKIKKEQEKTQEALNKIEVQKETIQKEQENTQEALDKALAMQAKMETAVFDKAVKEQIPEWKGYNNTYEDEKEEFLSQIDSLRLSSNALVDLPKEVKECSNLVYLDLSRNNVAQFPESVCELKNLFSLNLSDNYFTSISPQIKKLKKLKQLSIYNSDPRVEMQLHSIPLEIGELSGLEELYLIKSLGTINKLPKGITKLHNLKVLDISWNSLSDISGIGKLKNLEWLNLNYSQITQSINEIPKLTNLKYLSIEFTQINTLPKEIQNLKNLQELILNGNFISDEEKERIQDLLPNCKISF